MANRKKSSINISSSLLGKEQNIELQERSGCFLIVSRGIEAKNEEEQQLLKEIAKLHQLDENLWDFRKEFAYNVPISEVYRAIHQMIKAICEFEREKKASKILSVRIPTYLKVKLAEEKNPSELVRALLEKHLEKKQAGL